MSAERNPPMHDPRASEALAEILAFPCEGGTLREVYGPKDLAGLILGNLNRHHLVLVDVKGRPMARANRAETKLLVSEQDVEHWAAYAQSLEAVVRKIAPLLPGPRGYEVAFTPDESETLRQVPGIGE